MKVKGNDKSQVKIKTNLILMDPYIVDYSIEIPTRFSFVIEFIILIIHFNQS